LTPHAQHYRSRANEKAEPQPAPAESPAESKAVFGVRIRKTLRNATGEEQMSEKPDFRDWESGTAAVVLKYELSIVDLISQRDEARAELADLKRKITEDWVSVSGDMPGICGEAESRGFERGVKEAAKVYETGKSEDMEWISFIGVKDAILALLEPTETKQP
jgi:hypothetical protein